MSDYEERYIVSNGGSGNTAAVDRTGVGSEGPGRIQVLITTAVAPTVITVLLWVVVPLIWNYFAFIAPALLIALGYAAVVVYRRMI